MEAEEIAFVQEMRKDEQFGWLYIWNARDVDNRPRFFGGYGERDRPGAIGSAIPTEYEGGVLKNIYRGDTSRLQIYEVTGPIISKLPRLLRIYESALGAT